MKKLTLIILIYLTYFSNLSSNEFKLDEVIKNLSNTWSLSFITDEDILVTEK